MILYRSRRAVQIENDSVRVTVLIEGGHLAEILDKRSGLNPLWTPPWPSIEHSAYDPQLYPEYGSDSESKLLAGIMGHNLCIDMFGPPSPEEAEAGLTVHGEASVVPYQIAVAGGELIARAAFPLSALAFERRITLPRPGVVQFCETLENVAAHDRPIAWTEHVTLSPPFLEHGKTEFRVSATKSKVLESEFGTGGGYMQPGAEFDWPHVPRAGGGAIDLRRYTAAPESAGYTAHLMDPKRQHAWFIAWSPDARLAFGYVWRRADFPWMGMWEENHARKGAPWNGVTVTRGMEFGVSPMAETRREMIDRGTLFGERTYRWIPARTQIRVEYCAFALEAASIPETVEWDGTELHLH